MPTADAARLRALVSAVRRSGERRRVLAVRADPVWSGPDVVDTAEGPLRVVAARSPLAVRAALVDHDDDGLLAVLTPCDERDLGLDVTARLAKGRVLTLDPWQAVLSLFGVDVLDPALVEERSTEGKPWLVDDLIALAPPGGWPDRRPVSGVLDIDLAWRTWQDVRLGLDREPETTADVLALPDGVGVALADLDADRRARLAVRWARDGGPAGVLVDLLADGRGAEVVPLGLVVGLVWTPVDDPVLAEHQRDARIRLENLVGRDRLDVTSARVWAAAAEQLASGPAVERAEALLGELGAAALAELSDVLPGGFERRLGRLARALAARDLPSAEDALDAVERHRQAARRAHRVEMAAAAVRLLRRTTHPPVPVPSSFAAAVTGFAADGAWVDEARTLLGEGETVPDLMAVYQRLADDADHERHAGNERFARLLADWLAAEPLPDDRLVPLERLLDDVVAPVAAAAPVLVVVCDGMGLPVAHRLRRDLAADGWTMAAPAGQGGWPVGVAVLPTVTETCRTSLLAGQRLTGGQPEEQAGFTRHPGLKAASPANRPPVLFHKGALVAPSGVALPDDVRRAVADPAQRVVGVVVNSVDDHLTRGDQVRVGWDLSSLRPLGWLLDAAAEAGRVVVLTADHGHVLDAGRSRQHTLSGLGGERWRVAPPPPGEGELEMAGPRVLLGGGRIIVPVDEHLRYGVPKHGYHGGATPQEVVVPVMVLARRLPDGWVHLPDDAPAWWQSATTSPAPAPPVEPPAAPPPSGRRKREQASLFEPAPAVVDRPAPAGWVDELLASPTFATARKRLARPLPDERIRTYLGVIDANGGAIPLAALAARCGEPADTLRLALGQVQRLVNLDGAEVLAVRADGTVELNRMLLAEQFEVRAG